VLGGVRLRACVEVVAVTVAISASRCVVIEQRRDTTGTERDASLTQTTGPS
jgi:hypothetical protein